MQANITLSSIVQFAGDTSVMIQSYKEYDHKMMIENTFLELKNWFAVNNGLKLDINKTKLLHFHTKHSKNMIFNNIDNCHAIENAVLLGLTMHGKLNWNMNVQN